MMTNEIYSLINVIKQTTENLKRVIKYDFIYPFLYEVIHPFLSKTFLERFESRLQRMWTKRVLMIHIGRSGSTILGSLLDQTEAILWDGETYAPYIGHFNTLKNPGSNPEISKFPLEPLKVLRNHMILRKLLYFHKTIYGCEVKFFHIRRIEKTMENYLEYLEKKLGFEYFIILERKNYLRVLVSSLISNQNLKKFHITNGEQPQLIRIKIDVDKVKTDAECKPLLNFLQDYRDNFQNLENLLRNRRVLKLTYEDDICENPLIAAQKVCEFLDIECQKVKIKYRKNNPFSLESMIINYDEVKQTLQGTEFEWMIGDY